MQKHNHLGLNLLIGVLPPPVQAALHLRELDAVLFAQLVRRHR